MYTCYSLLYIFARLLAEKLADLLRLQPGDRVDDGALLEPLQLLDNRSKRRLEYGVQ